MKLAVVQMALGAFIVASLFGFTAWVEPSFTHVQIPPTEGSNIVTKIFLNPGRNIPMRSWMVVYLVLGLSVLSCGIAQFVKVKGLKGAKPL